MPWVWTYCALAAPLSPVWAWVWRASLATGDPMLDCHLRPDGHFDFVLLPQARNPRVGMVLAAATAVPPAS